MNRPICMIILNVHQFKGICDVHTTRIFYLKRFHHFHSFKIVVKRFFLLFYCHCTTKGLGWAGRKGNNAISFSSLFIVLRWYMFKLKWMYERGFRMIKMIDICDQNWLSRFFSDQDLRCERACPHLPSHKELSR